jgi:hypothetical protein
MTGMKRILILLPLLAFLPAYLFSTPVSVNGKLKVTGIQLVNACGNAIQLRGVSSHGLQYEGHCLPAAALSFAAAAAGMGADVFRIAMYVDEGGYMTNPASFTSQVDTLVDQIGALGMYAIIDWHILDNPGAGGSGNPNDRIASARTFWEHEATQHKGKAYVIYEICNEPSPASVSWATIKQYADDIIPRIRAIDPDTVILVGTPVWSQLGAAVVSSPLSYANIMYVFHFYAASHSTSLITPYVGQIPIFASEWAASTSSGGGTLDFVNATNFLNIFAANKISWCSWSYSDANESSAMFNVGTCPGGPYDVAHLSSEGNYIRNNILTPGETFICGAVPSNTPVITSTRTRTGTPTFTRTNGTTPTFTSTRTRTPTVTYTRTTGPSPTYTGTSTRTATYTPTPAPSSVSATCGAGIVIDGNLSDAAWQTGAWTVNNRLVTGTNPQGVTSQFKVRWDNTNLYVAVDVTDSTPFNDSGANWYDDSSVEVYLDMNHNRSTT